MLPPRTLRCFLLIATGLLMCQARAQLTYALENTVLLIDEVVDSSRVDIPWEIIWGPDDRLWMTDGPLITRWDPTTDMLDTLLDRGHGNGMGMAFHPDFPNTPQVFAVFDSAYYYGGGQFSEVFQFTYDPQDDTLIGETLLTSFRHQGEHSGGRILFDASGALLINTAEWFNGPVEVDGNTLRLWPDGSIPSDNPWGDERWTRGHRNAQGLAMLPNGNVVNTELCDGGSEIDRLTAGKNYGWHEYDGLICFEPDSCDTPLYEHELPIVWFWQPVSGCQLYTSAAIAEFTNRLIACALMSGGLVSVPFSAQWDSAFAPTHYTGGVFSQPMPGNSCGRIRDIAIRPDGGFYLITNDRYNARIRYVHPDEGNAVQASDHIAGTAPWPNPVQDQLSMPLPPGADWTLRDGQGRIVTAPGYPIGDRLVLRLGDLPAGLYFLTASLRGEQWVHRVVRQ